MEMDVKFFNVVMLGVSFMLIFTAFQTTSNVEEYVLNDTVRDGKKFLKGMGYYSLCIIYAVFSVANFIAPSIVSLIGPRSSMFCGGICYCLFIGSLIYPFLSTLFIGSVIVGLGAAVIWTAQGNFLTINSNDETMARNSGIFWALLQCSLLFGNMFVYFYFNGKTQIDDTTRITLFTVFTVTCVIGTLSVLILRKPPHLSNNKESDLPFSSDEDTGTSAVKKKSKSYGVGPQLSPLEAFKRSFQLLFTTDMLLLAVTIFYTGLELTFFSGVYGASVGHSTLLVHHERQIGLVGMMIGVGEITGGLLFGIFGKKTIKYGRDPVVLLGFIVHSITFYLIFLNIPDEAPIGDTSKDAFLHESLAVVVLSGFLLGFGDSSFNTQIFSILGSVYSEDSASAFALFKFIQSVAAAIGFGYSGKIVLKWQLLILVISGIVGTLCFFAVERRHASRVPPASSNDDGDD